jgi:hypothetical protein
MRQHYPVGNAAKAEVGDRLRVTPRTRRSGVEGDDDVSGHDGWGSHGLNDVVLRPLAGERGLRSNLCQVFGEPLG